MDTLVAVYLFVIGLLFGSFILVVVDRSHVKRNWVHGRSKCDFCGYKLQPRDLVPIVSWLMQGGKCRNCKKKLSPMYPASELAVGILFVLSYYFVPYDISGIGVALFIIWLAAIVLLVALIIADIRWFLLPNRFIYPLIGLGFLHALLVLLQSDAPLWTLFMITTAVLIGSGVFYVLHVVSKGKWIGDGDVRLGFAMGLFIANPLAVWISIFIASCLGLLFAVPQILKTKGVVKLKTKIPFGPFLIVGFICMYWFGESVVDWYAANVLYL